ncbi:ActS/PrrB/RegB family redox-sensitive histidine kinase [Rhodoplanes sp. SY1]|uniref:ActS/PrrB/RegB family redox-sensitive histidine kinase n=1 Tax=Rhodoplanes sp. SY1 TaxID=3166646 RepID=UPI0038B64683
MTTPALSTTEDEPSRPVRLDTLVRLRWIAVFGQLAAVLIVHDSLVSEALFWVALAVVTLYGSLNVYLLWRFHGDARLEANGVALLLGVDIAELAILLFLTGGMQNPFALLFIGPVLISASILPSRLTLMLGLLAIASATVLMFAYFPLPWPGDGSFELPWIYVFGVWLALALAIGYISVYAGQIAEESRKLTQALAATELVLAREQHLSQLDGLAAAAAHELGTPLATILLVAKELENDLDPASPMLEDIRLLRQQAQRCREILSKLSEFPAPGEMFVRMPIAALVEDVVAPHRTGEAVIDVVMPSEGGPEPIGVRNPAILYGLGNLVENAADFARERVEVAVSWNADSVWIMISDDGPGFPPEIMDRLGKPYVTSRRGRRKGEDSPGLGLGFFIAKTLLERSGGRLTLQNRRFPQRGAIVRIRWSREEFEHPAETLWGSAEQESEPDEAAASAGRA